MALADFRVQIWADPSFWEHLDKQGGGTREKWYTLTMAFMVSTFSPTCRRCPHNANQIHKLLLLRNMHDEGGADIPILAVAWDEEIMDRALDYRVRLSRGEWSETDHQASCKLSVDCFRHSAKWDLR